MHPNEQQHPSEQQGGAAHNWVHLMTKRPVPGQVKTRLIKDLGVEGATQAYWALLAWMSANIYAPKQWRNALWLAGPLQAGAPQDVVQQRLMALFDPKVYHYRSQQGERLGERINTLLSSDGVKHFVVGGDCVSVNQGLIGRVFTRLDCSDICIGPTQDGGFYFIAAKAPIVKLDTQVRWGSRYALADVIRVCEHQGLSVDQFEPGLDVDTLDDWRVFQAQMNAG